MNTDAMNTIATQVPTPLEELSLFGIPGEHIERENGVRLIKSIRSFVELENLQKYIDCIANTMVFEIVFGEISEQTGKWL
jgi:hypothetical protein